MSIWGTVWGQSGKSSWSTWGRSGSGRKPSDARATPGPAAILTPQRRDRRPWVPRRLQLRRRHGAQRPRAVRERVAAVADQHSSHRQPPGCGVEDRRAGGVGPGLVVGPDEARRREIRAGGVAATVADAGAQAQLLHDGLPAVSGAARARRLSPALFSPMRGRRLDAQRAQQSRPIVGAVAALSGGAWEL